jgi:hypothetical protein
MSFSRGTKGEVLWSTCSAEVMDKLNLPCLDEVSAPPAADNDHMAKYKNVPGKSWTDVMILKIFPPNKLAIITQIAAI